MPANTMPADDALRAAQAEYAAALHEVETKRWWELNALSDASAALIQAQAERITTLETALDRILTLDGWQGEDEAAFMIAVASDATAAQPDDAGAGDDAREG